MLFLHLLKYLNIPILNPKLHRYFLEVFRAVYFKLVVEAILVLLFRWVLILDMFVAWLRRLKCPRNAFATHRNLHMTRTVQCTRSMCSVLPESMTRDYYTIQRALLCHYTMVVHNSHSRVTRRSHVYFIAYICASTTYIYHLTCTHFTLYSHDCDQHQFLSPANV